MKFMKLAKSSLHINDLKIRVYRNTSMFFCHFFEGQQLFASLDKDALPECGLLFASSGANCFLQVSVDFLYTIFLRL